MQVEERKFLIENIDKYSWVNLTQLYNDAFKTEYTMSSIRHKCYRA